MVGQGLAGMVEQDNKRQEDAHPHTAPTNEESKVSYKRIVPEQATVNRGVISKKDQETLNYFQSLRQSFTESELLQVLEIIDVLSHQKESIASMLELLKEESEGQEDNSEEMEEGRFNSSNIQNTI